MQQRNDEINTCAGKNIDEKRGGGVNFFDSYCTL